MWGACRVSLKVLALACPEMKRKNPWWRRSGLSSHPHLKATHGQGPQFTCLSNGETGPNGMEKRDFYRQSDGQGPSSSASPRSGAPRKLARPAWAWGGVPGAGSQLGRSPGQCLDG
ncbi:Fanconi-Associated Nuclease 1 [Manis pentadactyla]|nr:Fanconi-Associated Nuclease 1 [Manis pentadactyla]